MRERRNHRFCARAQALIHDDSMLIISWSLTIQSKSKRPAWVLKITLLVSLPVPLILWPITAIIGSLLGGIGYPFFAPLIATFEGIGENITCKIYHCFSVVKAAKLHLVSPLVIPVDVPFITAVALWKSPFMLFRGWKRLLEDLIEMEGPFLETVCVPFVGLAIFLGPLAVAGSVVASFFSSFALALDSGVVVHKVYLLSFLCFPHFTMEDSCCMGLAYILAAVSMFDE